MGKLLSQGPGPQFRCQTAERLGSHLDSLNLFVAASVPYDHLVFLRSDSGFAANFEFVVSLFREHGGLVTERIRNVTVEVADFSTTNSRTKNAVEVEEFVLPPGTFQVRVTMANVSESKARSRWEGKVELSAGDSRLRLSDIFWVSEDSALAEIGVPRLVESFVTTEDDANARLQFYSTGTDSVTLRWQVKEETGTVVMENARKLKPDSMIQVVDYHVDLSALSAKRYSLVVEVEGNGRLERRTREFGVRIPGVPSSIHDLDLAIKQLKYIASGVETRQFRQAAPAARQKLFHEFWEKRDPNAETPENELMNEYYFRVETANSKFTSGRDGWETDRGRIYVLYGEPTDIESHPFDAGSRPYEIWYYNNLARRFVFVDYSGFGDYTLAGPEWGY